MRAELPCPRSLEAGGEFGDEDVGASESSSLPGGGGAVPHTARDVQGAVCTLRDGVDHVLCGPAPRHRGRCTGCRINREKHGIEECVGTAIGIAVAAEQHTTVIQK